MRFPVPKLATLASLLLPAMVVLLVWLPVVSFHAVPDVSLEDSLIEAARNDPGDEILEEIADFDLLAIDNRTREMEISVAEGILRGELALPGLVPAPISLPFSPEDLERLPSDLQLFFAGYVVPDFLTAAYAETGRAEFIAMARETILAWDRYERTAWLPRGYLWNDHAIAARVRVLGEFWRHYRQRADYKSADGRVVLEQAARYREILSDPGHFTFATNHGLMQNVALLDIELAFPTLPDSDRYRQLALDRLAHQLSFLMDEDGVIRENSAGYQRFGLDVLGMAFRSMTMLGTAVPAEWARKYERGFAMLARLERPDGTLPASGDTDGSSRRGYPRATVVDGLGASGPLHPPAATRPDREWSVHPAAGYWIEWDGLSSWPDAASMSQTVVTWTRPPAPSHKHADELSVLVWSKGVSWLTSVGYWPYGEPGRADAESWPSSNAPHRADEPSSSERSASLLSAGWNSRSSALDLERRGPGAYVARRQIVHVKPDLWVIIDHVRADSTARNETVWTLAPEVRARRDELTDSYVLVGPDGLEGRLTVLGSPGTVMRDFSGSRSPFAGWHVRGSVPRPAPAIAVEQPAGDAWTVVVLSTAESASPLFYSGGEPEMSAGTTADAWAMTLPIASGQLRLTRDRERISIREEDGAEDASTILELAPALDTSPERASLEAAFEQVARRYPVFQERISARARVTGAVAVVLLVQEVLLLLVRRARPTLVVPLRVVGIVGWLAAGVLLHAYVLRAWDVLRLPA